MVHSARSARRVGRTADVLGLIRALLIDLRFERFLLAKMEHVQREHGKWVQLRNRLEVIAVAEAEGETRAVIRLASPCAQATAGSKARTRVIGRRVEGAVGLS